MRRVLSWIAVWLAATVAQAADVDAGKSKVEAVCAACHGAAGVSVSDAIPNLAAQKAVYLETQLKALKDGTRNTVTRYHTINFPATRQVRHYFANRVALESARQEKPLPDGSYLFVEVWSAMLDADKKPVMGNDGFYVADQLLFHTAMARDAGWGNDIPEMLRNENWNYAAFSTDGKPRAANQAECLACHKPLDKVSFTSTLDQLKAAPR